MGLPQPKFSPQEADSIHARFAKNGGQAIGIIIGLKENIVFNIIFFKYLRMSPGHVSATFYGYKQIYVRKKR